MTGGRITTGGAHGGGATTTGGWKRTGTPKLMLTEIPARAGAANPAASVIAATIRMFLVFIHQIGRRILPDLRNPDID